MPGWLDSLVGGIGDIFSGGGGGIDPSGGIDWSQTTPFDAVSVADNVVDPASIFTDVGGLTDTPSWLSNVGDVLNGGGGLGGITSLFKTPLSGLLGGGTAGGGSPLTSILPGAVKALSGGGTPAGTTPGSATTPGVPAAPGVPSAPAPAPAAGGTGGIGGVISGLLGNPALTAMIPAIFQAINAKDQTDLGPDAAAERALATKNQGLSDSLAAEAAAEKLGQLPGPALASLSTSLAEQKAAMRQRYSQMGMSGSSAEGADMAALNAQNEGQRFQIGLGMANEGLSQVQNLNSQDVGIYQNLMQAQAERDKEYMDAMATLAEGLGKAFATPTGAPTTAAPGAVAGATGNPLIDQLLGITSKPIDPSLFGTSTPIDPSTLATVLPGIDPSTLITPDTTVPFVNTPADIPDLTSLLAGGGDPGQVGARVLEGM